MCLNSPFPTLASTDESFCLQDGKICECEKSFSSSSSQRVVFFATCPSFPSLSLAPMDLRASSSTRKQKKLACFLLSQLLAAFQRSTQTTSRFSFSPPRSFISQRDCPMSE